MTMSPHSTTTTNFDTTTMSHRKDSNASPVMLIRKLARTLDANALKSMLVFAKDLISVDFIPNPTDEGEFKTAVARFATSAACQEAKSMLDGKWNSNGDAHLVVNYVPVSPGGSSGLRRALEAATSEGIGSTRPASKFSGQFSPFEQVSSPTLPTSPFSSTEGLSLSDSFSSSMFPPQGPLGSPLERQRISGKSVINEDSADDETGKLINDPVAFAKNDMAVNGGSQPRRSTMPQLPINRLSNLSIHPPNGSPNLNNTFSPRALQSPTAAFSHQATHTPSNAYNNMQYPRSNMPPVNPADQNPPCNTLYVGNLPQDTAEDELKLLFSKQRGYKRLCFRVKQQGPMCFVEFEDVSFATKALNELYGHMLSNSVKGGIRLSFSKNPLGVRANQQQNGLVSPLASPGSANGMTYGSMTAFAAASGPPPGLSMPSPYGVMSPVQNSAFGGFNPMSASGMANQMHGIDNSVASDLSGRSPNGMSATNWASVGNSNNYHQYGRPLYS